MKKKDTLDRRLGPTIREIGNRHGLSVTNLKSALAESFNDRRKGWADENVEYGEETIGGYLYDRTWPDMECQTCIDIVTAAFESAVLSDRTNENAIRKGQQQVKSEIERLYREYERKAYLDTYILYRLCRFHALEAAETQAFSALNIPLATPCFAPYRSCSRALLWDG